MPSQVSTRRAVTTMQRMITESGRRDGARSPRGERNGSAASSASGSSGGPAGGGGGGADSKQQQLLLQGTLTLLCQAFCNAAYILLQRKLLQPPRCFPVLTLTALGFLVAAFCMSAFSAITPGWHR